VPAPRSTSPTAARHRTSGILITHRTGNNLNNIAYREMAKRGFVGVWLNTRFINNEALVKSEGITLDVKAAVD
jgi:hypothetical protein